MFWQLILRLDRLRPQTPVNIKRDKVVQYVPFNDTVLGPI
jgi:hypothetical protein